MVALASPPHDSGSDEEDHGGQEEGQPEADVFLRVHHADLTRQSAEVDEQVEVMVDTGLGNCWVDKHFLALLRGIDVDTLHLDLLNNERRDVWFETTGSETHDDQTEHEDAECGGSIGDDWWDGGDDQDDVADNCDADTDADGLVASPVLVGHVGSKQWQEVDPETVEGVDGIGGLWSFAERTGDTLV